jgi:dCMP deaminase
MKPEKQLKYDKAYLKMAQEWSQLSYCDRRKVGALIVKDKMIISDGYNGTPSGFENICEDDEGYTKWYVLHAEANARAQRYTSRCLLVKVVVS